MHPTGKKPIWVNSDDDDDFKPVPEVHQQHPQRFQPPLPILSKFEATSSNDLQSNSLLHSPASSGASSDDTGSTTTDRSGSEPPLDISMRMLRRMSSVTLMEQDDQPVASVNQEEEPVQTSSSTNISVIVPGGNHGGGDDDDDDEATNTPTSSSYQGESDDDVRFLRTVEPPIPLNCMTQEKAHHPRKRPAPSPLQSYAEFSWKRHSHQPSPATITNTIANTTNLIWKNEQHALPSFPTKRSQHNTLASLASDLYRQLEAEAVGTLVVYQPTCLDHHNDTHQENRQRLSVLCGPNGVFHKERFKDLRWANLNELRPARLNDLLRVHTFEYLQHLERACGNLPEQSEEYSVGPLYDEAITTGSKNASSKELLYSDWMKTAKAQKCYEVEELPSGGSFDTDSPISKSSYLAARLAAGAVCHAIDKVVNNETKNAFVVVRPPGHHAGPNGCVEGDGFHRRPDMCTCGFCLLNNVAIGAGYAMSTYNTPYYAPPLTKPDTNRPANIERVAIVDFDIHHGNGTEDCIRNLIPHKQNYPLPPSWSPLQFSSYKPWRDEKDSENVFFASIHLFDDDNFYPCSGHGPHGCSPELRDHPNILNLPLDVLGPKYLEDRLKLSSKAKKQLMEKASHTFRQNVTDRLLPALKKFNPDLILLSAGFDGHADDFYYFLSEDDYGWITEQITLVAEDCCDGRIVSVLEGGYNVVPAKAQKPKTKKHTTSNFHHAAKLHNREVDEELHTYGSLARSCAAHVTALLRASQG